MAGGAAWTHDDDAALRANACTGLYGTWPELARTLGRSTAAVKMRASRLGARVVWRQPPARVEPAPLRCRWCSEVYGDADTDRRASYCGDNCRVLARSRCPACHIKLTAGPDGLLPRECTENYCRSRIHPRARLAVPAD